MPIISRFFGIVIYIYWRDHAPPHFHAIYGDYDLTVTGNGRRGNKSYLELILWSNHMILHVIEAKYLHDYVIWLRFNDDAEGEIDLSQELEGEVFGPLNDKAAFKAFKVDPEAKTIMWEYGADLAPEFLYENMKVLK